MWLWRYTINTFSYQNNPKELTQKKNIKVFSVQIFAQKYLQLWEFSPCQTHHSTAFSLNEYQLVMILGPVVTCIYWCIYPPSCGSKNSYAAVDAASLTMEKKNPKNIKFRNSVQAPFHTGKKKKSQFYLISFQMK